MEDDQLEDIIDHHNNLEDVKEDISDNQNSLEDNKNNSDSIDKTKSEPENFRVTRSGRRFSTYIFSQTLDLPEPPNFNNVIYEMSPNSIKAESFPNLIQEHNHQERPTC